MENVRAANTSEKRDHLLGDKALFFTATGGSKQRNWMGNCPPSLYVKRSPVSMCWERIAFFSQSIVNHLNHNLLLYNLLDRANLFVFETGRGGIGNHFMLELNCLLRCLILLCVLV